MESEDITKQSLYWHASREYSKDPRSKSMIDRTLLNTNLDRETRNNKTNDSHAFNLAAMNKNRPTNYGYNSTKNSLKNKIAGNDKREPESTKGYTVNISTFSNKKNDNYNRKPRFRINPDASYMEDEIRDQKKGKR